MHVQQAIVAGAIVQIIDILGDEQEVAGPFRLQPCQRQMRGIGHHLAEEGAALIVELLHQCGIAAEGLWGGDILHPMAFLQAIGGAEGGHAGFGRNAGAGEDDDVAAHARHDKAGQRGAASMAQPY